jgi:hypothetical protein
LGIANFPVIKTLFRFVSIYIDIASMYVCVDEGGNIYVGLPVGVYVGVHVGNICRYVCNTMYVGMYADKTSSRTSRAVIFFIQ